MISEIDLSNYTLLDVYGIERNQLNGSFTKETLSKKLISEWVDYVECKRKCPRSDYCKYVQSDPNNPDRSIEIKCGVAADALKNFVDYTFRIFEFMTDDQIQNYLDSIFYYYKFVISAEFTIGDFINRYYLESWHYHAPTVFGSLKYLRESLDKYCSLLQDIDDFKTKKGILFVEGDSEEKLLNTLKKSDSAWFLDTIIENYQGSGNRREKRIRMLLDAYKKKGYEIYLQGDADGKDNTIFKTFVDKGIITTENQFVFEYDFESSIPHDLLFVSLKSMKLVNDDIKKDFFEKLANFKAGSITPYLNEQFQINIADRKVELAETVGKIINNTYYCWSNEQFINSELGKFLRFVQGIF